MVLFMKKPLGPSPPPKVTHASEINPLFMSTLDQLRKQRVLLMYYTTGQVGLPTKQMLGITCIILSYCAALTDPHMPYIL